MIGQAWTFGKKVSFGFGLSVVMLILVSAVAYRSTDALVENNRRVTHSHEVLESLAQVLSFMKDAETGQRGYLLTGNDTYLEPYVNAVAGIARLTDRLRSLTADSPSQESRVAQAMPIIDAKLAELKLTIELRRSQGFEAALRVVETDKGKTSMDALRVLMASMDQDERSLLKERSDVAEAGAR